MEPEQSDLWPALVAAAMLDVEQAEKGDPVEGRRILFLATVAMTNLLDRAEQPSPRDTVFLRALLKSLKAIIGKGEDANKALHIAIPPHRPPTGEELTDLRTELFIAVGREYDRLTALGRTRADAPVREAYRTVARTHASGTSAKSVEKAWSDMGGLVAWADWKAMEADSQ
jgi:hypothetical protein